MRTFILGCAAAALIACGGRTDTKYGLEGPELGGASTSDYPTGDYGYVVGKVLPDLAFMGYAHFDPATTIDTASESVVPIRLADFYTPNSPRRSLLFISVQLVWCGPSNEQEDFTNGGSWTGQNQQGTVDYALDYASRGVRFMTLLAQGPTVGTDATPLDLKNWVDHHHARIPEGLLPSTELSIDVIEAAMPYNIIVDTRTMRVVDAYVGFDFMGELDKLVSRGLRE